MSCQLLNCMKRLNLSSFSPVISRTIFTDGPSFFKSSSILYAEPLKKKKRIDPAIVRAREERKKKKLERAIKKLKKQANQPVPIEDIEVPFELIDQKELRTRPPVQWTEQELEEKYFILKQWNQYKNKCRLRDLQMIDRLLYSQQRALDELKNESLSLYEAAIQIDPELIPYSAKGPTHTPPIKDYESPDGEYLDVTKKWE